MNWMKSSERIYSTLLYLYPVSVRRNDGAAMVQVFGDLAREDLRNFASITLGPRGALNRAPALR